MGLQSFAGQRDLELPAVLDELDLDAADIGHASGDLLRQSKPVREIFKIARRRHHDREGRAAYDDLKGRFDRDRSGELRPAGARIKEKARTETSMEPGRSLGRIGQGFLGPA